MAIALTPNQTREWSTAADRKLPPEQRTVFLLRGVPFAVRTRFGVLLGQAGGSIESCDPEQLARLQSLALRCCLVGWRNFKTSEGSEVVFVSESITIDGTTLHGCASIESVEVLDLETLSELATESLLGMVLQRRDVLG